MGKWKIEIEGGPSDHGCDRRAIEGETLQSCGRSTCPDCVVVETLSNLQRRGVMVEGATITHWPGTPEQVVDHYRPGTITGTVIGTRHSGDFRPKPKAAPADTLPEHADEPKS
jgi:hypothetical protein